MFDIQGGEKQTIRKKSGLENFIVFNLVIFAFDIAMQEKSEESLRP